MVKPLGKGGFSNLLGLFRLNKRGFNNFMGLSRLNRSFSRLAGLFRLSKSGFSSITGLFRFRKDGFSNISREGGFIGLFKLSGLLGPLGRGSFRGFPGLLGPLRLLKSGGFF